MDLEFGNAGSIDTRGTGWFVGFSDWTRAAKGGGGPRRCVTCRASSARMRSR